MSGRSTGRPGPWWPGGRGPRSRSCCWSCSRWATTPTRRWSRPSWPSRSPGSCTPARCGPGSWPSDAGVTVVNPLREHVLPWSAVTQVDLKHNVRVHYRGPAGDTIVHSWAVQSSGRSRTRHELRARRAARRGTAPEPGYARLPGEAQAALAGSAAEFIARQLSRTGPDAGISGPAGHAPRQPAGALDLGPHRGDSGSVAAARGRGARLRPAGGLAMCRPEPRPAPPGASVLAGLP